MLLIQNGMRYVMESEDPIRADLLIKDEKIAQIARKITLKKGMKIIDAYPAQTTLALWEIFSFQCWICENETAGMVHNYRKNQVPAGIGGCLLLFFCYR